MEPAERLARTLAAKCVAGSVATDRALSMLAWRTPYVSHACSPCSSVRRTHATPLTGVVSLI